MTALASCADARDVDGSPAALAARVAPHTERIARFDRWARRIASASAAWRSRSALEETAFSQVRTDPAVVGAWIARQGETALAHPPGADVPSVTLRRVRVDALGECDVGTATMTRARETIEVLVVAIEHDGLTTTLALAP